MLIPNYSDHLASPTVAFEDRVNEVYRIMPMPSLDMSAVIPQIGILSTIFDGVLKTGVKGKNPSHKQMKKIPRPSNAFILYRQYHHPVVKSTHPECHNNEICEFAGVY